MVYKLDANKVALYALESMLKQLPKLDEDTTFILSNVNQPFPGKAWSCAIWKRSTLIQISASR